MSIAARVDAPSWKLPGLRIAGDAERPGKLAVQTVMQTVMQTDRGKAYPSLSRKARRKPKRPGARAASKSRSNGAGSPSRCVAMHAAARAASVKPREPMAVLR
jgi:hypothetical protein